MGAAALIGFILFLNPVLGQTIVGLGGDASGHTRFNADLKEQSRPEGLQPKVVVFVGDRVIPHFIDGQFWQTAITVINLENHSTTFDILFFRDDGTDLYMPIAGVGSVRALTITLATAGSLTFQTTGTASALSSGWALLSQTNTDSVGSFAVFRYSQPGLQPQEAVIPTVNQFFGHFVLPFDNTAQFVTGVALANPTFQPVLVPVTIRNEQGQVIDKQLFSLGKFSHAAFVLPTTWTSTAGIRGTAEFQTSGFGVGALGIRANGNSFTSLSVLTNFNWLN